MIEKMLHTLLSEFQKISRTENVIGEPIQCGNSMVIPISRVQIGFGVATTGGATAEGEVSKNNRMKGAGSGGGIRVEPVACIVVDKSGHAQLLQLSSPSYSNVGKAIDLVPEVMERLGLIKDDKIKTNEKVNSQM